MAMKMKNKENKDHEYWRHRFELIEDSQNRKAKFINKDVERAFKKAQSEIQGKIDKWISRIAKNNGITILEAYKMLSNSELDEFRWSLEEYIKKGKENSFNGKWIKELENASAKAHITRLEALKIEVQQAIEEVYGYEHDQLDQLIRDSYSEGYYRPIFEFQRFFNVGWNPTSVNKNTLNKLVTKPWAPDDRTFSSRIWSNKSQMIDALDTELTKMCLTGAAPDKAIKHMAKFANGKFKNAKKAAGRLVMTESAYFASKGTFDSYKELGIEEFEIVATLDSRTSAICREKDGQHFPLELYEIGLTAPPFHPWCRSCTCPYFDDEFSIGERIARGDDGKNYYVPSNMTYKEWKKKLERDKTNDKINLKEELTDKDKKAINDYMSSKSYVVNEKLRNGSALTKDEETFVNNLDSALDKMPKFEGNLIRVVHFDNNEKTRDFLKEYVVGQPKHFKEYISTSKAEDYNPEAKIQIYIRNAKNGADISSINEGEQEVLYKRNSAFKIIKKVEVDDITYILMEEI